MRTFVTFGPRPVQQTLEPDWLPLFRFSDYTDGNVSGAAAPACWSASRLTETLFGKAINMSLGTEIAKSFDRSFALYDDLLDAIEESMLSSKLPSLPSNTIGLQLWCVVGARESFSKAIKANEWSGFSCSLETTTNKEKIGDALRRSAESASDVLKTIDTYTDVQSRLILDLLEHEAAHHGQLIRYIYGLTLPIPDSWKSKYALEEK